VFIPIEEEYRENTTGVKSQDHISKWTPEDFKDLGMKVDYCERFNHVDYISGALWASTI